MFSVIRKRFTFANVAMTLALVFAMTGGAYAAKKYLITSTSQISPKVLKALEAKGSKGPAGAAGAQGPQGPQGPAGANGKDGLAGVEGKEGPQGKTGPQGSTGKEGPTGKEGSPCTASCTLPAGKTEKGAWSFEEGGAGKASFANMTISFSIPLAAPLGESGVHLIAVSGEEIRYNPAIFGFEEVSPKGCTGGTVAAPAADPGNFCMYITEVIPGSAELSALASQLILSPATTCEGLACFASEGGPGAGTSVAGARFTFPDDVEQMWGTWAVTAPAS